MKLGSVIYFIPFVFIMDTALLLQGSWIETLTSLSRVLVGIWLLVAGLQGYLQGFGSVRAVPLRLGLVVAGLGIAFANLLFQASAEG